ncbi:hypothetical protein Bbad01_11370 [Bacillus badius]|nr:hypothetical protein Bbad01_11370 [Bacillus badius]
MIFQYRNPDRERQPKEGGERDEVLPKNRFAISASPILYLSFGASGI